MSRALNVPLETVRRRVGQLLKMKVLGEQKDGLIFLADNPHGIGNNAALLEFNLRKLGELFRTLKAFDVELG